MDLDIVLLPPKNVSRQIGQNVLRVGRQVPLAWAVDGKKLLPHISLLHINTSRIKEVCRAVRMIAEDCKRLSINFIKPHAGQVYFVAEVKNSRALYALHRRVVTSIGRLSQGLVKLPPVGKTALQKKYMREYGVGNVLKYFYPHITLGGTREKKDLPMILRLIGKLEFTDFTATRLALAKVNKHHQVIKIIKEFKIA